MDHKIVDNRNLNVLPEPFASSDVSIRGTETDVILDDVIVREKVAIVGDETVGKTSIVQSFLKMDQKPYSKNYHMTTNLDVQVSEISVPNTNITVDLFLFDMGGQSIFNQRQMAERFWENCTYVICVFDVSSRKSMQSAKTWVASVRSASSIPDNNTILVANKVDLREAVDSLVEIDQGEGKEFADEHGFQYFECSAETFVGVDAPFKYIANKSAKEYQSRIEPQ